MGFFVYNGTDFSFNKKMYPCFFRYFKEALNIEI